MMDLVTHLIAFAVGVLCAGAYAGFMVGKAQADALEWRRLLHARHEAECEAVHAARMTGC